MIHSEEKDLQKEDQIEKNLEQLDYPASEDIYNKEEKIKDIDPDHITNGKTIDEKEGEWNENSFNIDKENQTGEDLDVPGSELDDQQEEIGSEDEENNYYSESDTN
ncbi:hypothetical protein D0809_23885 [Flavobacterium circumlabens]|uniref:Uncharacterized protein n=1 Tax=Flavobacterium circumlabens TaxID=2133765 RepID=A0A4Y7U5L6_9FLAO|nr:hypothetical protein [Flavobacterium circumlabens]TCN50237.1 hypothetical protein EV142_11725 [Flavobacterium circumlabens]TEB41733.1 hypothetical protein D0809_23885 [Flavobacterium circumlabens]